jgi:hypothetical protein
MQPISSKLTSFYAISGCFSFFAREALFSFSCLLSILFGLQFSGAALLIYSDIFLVSHIYFFCVAWVIGKYSFLFAWIALFFAYNDSTVFVAHEIKLLARPKLEVRNLRMHIFTISGQFRFSTDANM